MRKHKVGFNLPVIILMFPFYSFVTSPYVTRESLRMIYKYRNTQQCFKKQILVIYIVHVLENIMKTHQYACRCHVKQTFTSVDRKEYSQFAITALPDTKCFLHIFQPNRFYSFASSKLPPAFFSFLLHMFLFCTQLFYFILFLFFTSLFFSFHSS